MENLSSQDGPAATAPDRSLAPTPANKSKTKKWPLIALIILLIVLGGVGYGWYYAYGQAMLLHRQMTWQWINDLPNFETQSSLDLQVKSVSVKDDSVNSLLPHTFSFSNSARHYNVGNDFMGQSEASLLLDDKPLEIDVDYAKKGQAIYFKPVITGLEALLSGLQGVLGVKEFDTDKPLSLDYATGQWVKSDLPDNKYLNDESLPEAADKVNDVLTKIKDRQVLQITDIHQSKNTNDGKLKALQYSISQDKAEDFVIILMEAREGDGARNVFNLFKTKNAEDWRIMQDAISNNVSLVLWVNTKTKNIQGMDINIKDFDFSASGNSAVFDLTASYLIVSVEPTDITAPTNTITPQEFLNNLMEATGLGEMFGISSEPKDFDYDGLSDEQEEVYGTDPNNPDSDGDGYLDGEEILHNYNPLGQGVLRESLVIPEL